MIKVFFLMHTVGIFQRINKLYVYHDIFLIHLFFIHKQVKVDTIFNN